MHSKPEGWSLIHTQQKLTWYPARNYILHWNWILGWMGSQPILPISVTITIDTMLKLNGPNFGEGYFGEGPNIGSVNQAWDISLAEVVQMVKALKRIKHMTSSSPTNACACTAWIKKAWLQSWPSRGQQVLHQRWIWGINFMQMMRHANKASIHRNSGKHH